MSQYEKFEVDSRSDALEYDRPNGKLAYERGKFRVTSPGGMTGGKTYTGIVPASGKNEAVLFDSGSISAREPDKLKCVSIRGISFGCTNNGVGTLANVPVPCKLYITPVDQTGKRGTPVSYEYEPKLSASILNGFKFNAPTRHIKDIHLQLDKPDSKVYELRVEIGGRPPAVASVLSLLVFLPELQTTIRQFYNKFLDNLSDPTGGLLFDNMAYEIVDCT